MGVCTSRCDETRHQGAGVGPATISHRNNSFDTNTESLKKFLHLHGTVDAKKTAHSSPRTSLGESLGLPHSSELFSLPPSEPDRSSFAISPSPRRTTRASHAANSSPKSRTCSVWSGRFAVDKTSSGCRKRVRPAPRTTEEHDAAAHQRLVEAIERLERLNDGKQCRSRAFSVSDLERQDNTKAPQLTASRSRHVRHYQLPLQLPKPYPDTANPVSPLANSVTTLLREVDSFVSLIEAPQETITKQTKSVHPKAISRLAVRYRCDETDSEEMFTFFEASSSTSSSVSETHTKTSLHRLVQSATLGCDRIEKLSPVGEKALVLPVAESATRLSECTTSLPLEANEGAGQCRGERGNFEAARPSLTDVDVNVVAVLEKSLSVKRSSPAWKGFRRRLSRSLDSRESAVVHVNFDSLFRSAPIAASRLSNVVVSDDVNTATSSHATLIDAKSAEELGLLSPGSDMCSCADSKIEHDVCEEEDEENCTVVFLDTSSVELTTLEQPQVVVATSDDSLSPWIREIQDQSPTTSVELCLDENPSLAERAADLEILSLQVLVEDQSPSTTAESSLRELKSFEGNLLTAELTSSEQSSRDEEPSPSTLASAESSFRELDDLDKILESPETNARCEETVSPVSTVCTEPGSPSLSSSCATESGEQADYHPIPDSTHSEVADPHRFLSNIFNSLLKLLQVTDREQAGTGCTAALHQDEEMESLAEETNE